MMHRIVRCKDNPADGRAGRRWKAGSNYLRRFLFVEHGVQPLVQLDRLHARLADEYELKERANGLSRKLSVIDETARALTDIIDTERSARLEITIVLLIVVELLVAFYDIFLRAAK